MSLRAPSSRGARLRYRRRRVLSWVYGALFLGLLGWAAWSLWPQEQRLWTPHAPPPGYTAETATLLRLAAEEVLDLERQQAYGLLYDRLGSVAFQKKTPRRTFLAIGHCVEAVVGPVVDADTRTATLHPLQSPQGPAHRLTLRVNRVGGWTTEQQYWVQEGLAYRLLGLYWQSPRPGLKDCLKPLMPKPPASPTPRSAASGPGRPAPHPPAR